MANQLSLADLMYQYFFSQTAGGVSGYTTGSGANVEDVPVTGEANGYIAVQFTGTFSQIYSFEQSNDNATWDTLYLRRVDAGPGGTWVSTATDATGKIYAGPVQAKYVRVRLSTDTSGTAVIYAKLGGAPPVAMDNASTAATVTSVADSATSITLLAANTGRRAASFFNDSSEVLYLDASGGTASTTSFSVKIAAGGYFELPSPVVVGLITGIWAANSTGSVRVTEYA